jgi:two-component system chemotaxis response regulator CheB
MINNLHKLPASNAADKEPVRPGRIYVAPPDRHLLLEKGRVRVTHGPKENRFRPAIDPLFRSAAYAYGRKVIGIILSGALDDGTAGLWYVKQCGGLALVQLPADAEVPSMPQHALREVAVDYALPVAEMAGVLVRLCTEPLPELAPVAEDDNGMIKKELVVATQDTIMGEGFKFGEPTMFSCPECNGALSALHEGGRTRYRCHTGHAFSAHSLLVGISENIENNLWKTIRSMEDNIRLLNHIGDHFAEINQPASAAIYFKKAKEAEEGSQQIRNVLRELDYPVMDFTEQEAGTG